MRTLWCQARRIRIGRRLAQKDDDAAVHTQLADMVREFLPQAQITFDNAGGREESGNFLVDNSRLRQEFEIEYPPLRTRVLEIVNDIRHQEGLPLIAQR